MQLLKAPVFTLIPTILAIIAFVSSTVQAYPDVVTTSSHRTTHLSNKRKKACKDTCECKRVRWCRDKIIIKTRPGMMDDIGARFSARVIHTSVTPPE